MALDACFRDLEGKEAKWLITFLSYACSFNVWPRSQWSPDNGAFQVVFLPSLFRGELLVSGRVNDQLLIIHGFTVGETFSWWSLVFSLAKDPNFPHITHIHPKTRAIKSVSVLLMEEILHQLMASLSHFIVAGFFDIPGGCLGFLHHQQYHDPHRRDVLPTALEGLKTLHLNNVVHRDVKLGAVVTGHRRWTAAIGWDKDGNRSDPHFSPNSWKFSGVFLEVL